MRGTRLCWQIKSFNLLSVVERSWATKYPTIYLVVSQPEKVLRNLFVFRVVAEDNRPKDAFRLGEKFPTL